MQASHRITRPAHTYLDHATAVIDAGHRLLVRTVLPLTAWPQLPAGWAVVAGSESAVPTERFRAYTNGPAVVTMQAVPDGDLEPPGRPVALMTLGPRRVSVSAHPAGARFDARWSCAGVDYRLSAGPTTLGEFMRLLMATGWR
jgi:hypothetical protein